MLYMSLLVKEKLAVPRARSLFAGLLFCLAALQSSAAAELIMFRSPGCPHCLAWDRAVGEAYPRSEFGSIAPLRMIDLDRRRGPDIELRRPVVFTPTFVLVEAGREVGRIEGFTSDEFFWGLLERLVGRLARE